MKDFAGQIGTYLKTALFGAIIIEALLEIIGDFLPRKYSVGGARVLGALIGIIIAFTFNITNTWLVSGLLTVQSVFDAVIAGLVMSRGSECVHAILKSIISLPKVIAGIINKQTIIAVQPPQSKTDSR